MKKLLKLVRDCDSMDITNQMMTFGDAFLPGSAATELNGLIVALSNTDPYVRNGGRLSPLCIHCKKKYDIAFENDIPKQHDESCVWLACWQLVEITRMAKDDTHNG